MFDEKDYYDKEKIRPFAIALGIMNKYQGDYEEFCLTNELCKLEESPKKLRIGTCDDCGAEIRDNSEFCSQCGRKID